MKRRLFSTIFAKATGTGKSGVAVIRISGKDSLKALQSLEEEKKTNSSSQWSTKPRCLRRTRLHVPQTGDLLDDALAVYFPSPHSFTGEDVVELHVHGSLAVTNGILEALSSLAGKSNLFQNSSSFSSSFSSSSSLLSSSRIDLRPAEPGEFIRRAFENGKLD